MIDVQTHELTPIGRQFLDHIRASASKTQKTHKRRQLSAEAAYYPLTCGGLVRY
jgi:hypothetical protein